MALAGVKTDAWREPFLAEFRIHGVQAIAARHANISSREVRRTRSGDREFAEAYEDALNEAIGNLEREAYRRAVEGVEKPMYDKRGTYLGTVHEYSDRLLEILLRGKLPAVYRDNARIEVSGPDGGPMQHEVAQTLGSLTWEERTKLAELARRVIAERAAELAPAG